MKKNLKKMENKVFGEFFVSNEKHFFEFVKKKL